MKTAVVYRKTERGGEPAAEFTITETMHEAPRQTVLVLGEEQLDAVAEAMHDAQAEIFGSTVRVVMMRPEPPVEYVSFKARATAGGCAVEIGENTEPTQKEDHG